MTYLSWNDERHLLLPDMKRIMRTAHGLALVRLGLAEIRSRRIMGPASDGALLIYKRDRTSPTGVHCFDSAGRDTPELRALVGKVTGRPIYASAAAGY